MEKKITKDMIISEILNINPNMGESLEEACYVHGIDPELMETRLNAFLEAMEKEGAV